MRGRVNALDPRRPDEALSDGGGAQDGVKTLKKALCRRPKGAENQ